MEVLHNLLIDPETSLEQARSKTVRKEVVCEPKNFVENAVQKARKSAYLLSLQRIAHRAGQHPCCIFSFNDWQALTLWQRGCGITQ